jgi:hypothetical protein
MDVRPVGPGGVDPVAAQARAERARTRPQGEGGFAGVLDSVNTDYPPPEVWRECDAAARAYETLKAQGRELHFGTDDDGKLRIEVRDTDGRLLRQVPATEAIEIAGGKPA